MRRRKAPPGRASSISTKPAPKSPSAQIKSNWAMLDAQTRRVKRVPMEIVQRFLAT